MHEAPCSQRNNLALGGCDSQRLKLLSWGKTLGSQDVSLPHTATGRPGAVGVHVCACVHVCVCMCACVCVCVCVCVHSCMCCLAMQLGGYWWR